MRIYHLYLIEDEFAEHYFGRERMFYKLFLELKHSHGEMNHILEKQVYYITKPTPSLKLHQLFFQLLSKRKDFYIENGVYYIEMNSVLSFAKLEVHDRKLVLTANGSYDAETCFFEVLRKNETSYLALDLEHDRFGWLKPIKERKYV